MEGYLRLFHKVSFVSFSCIVYIRFFLKLQMSSYLPKRPRIRNVLTKEAGKLNIGVIRVKGLIDDQLVYE